MKAWYEHERNNERLQVEAALLLGHFPDARLVVGADGQLIWNLTVRTARQTPFAVALAYPRDFPAGGILAFVLWPDLAGCPHRYKGGSLCLGHSATERSTALTVATWVATWLSCYEVWQATGEWDEFEK